MVALQNRETLTGREQHGKSRSASDLAAGRLRFPEPPPSVPGPPLSKLPQTVSKAYVEAVRTYYESIAVFGKPYPGWQEFERRLACEYALLVRLLSGIPLENLRVRLLKIFAESLNLGKRRGRPRKAQKDLRYLSHGNSMEQLWQRELKMIWQLKISVEKLGKDARTELAKRHVSQELIQLVTVPSATAESSLARLFAARSRSRISVGTARNAIRKYEAFTGKAITAE